MATHSSILAWRIPWIEEPGGLQSIESQRHGWSDLAHMPQGEGGWGHLLGEPSLWGWGRLMAPATDGSQVSPAASSH